MHLPENGPIPPSKTAHPVSDFPDDDSDFDELVCGDALDLHLPPGRLEAFIKLVLVVFPMHTKCVGEAEEFVAVVEDSDRGDEPVHGMVDA